MRPRVQLLLISCPGFSYLDMDIPVVNDIIFSVYQPTHAYDHLIASHTLFNLIIHTNFSPILCDSKSCTVENSQKSKHGKHVPPP